MVGHGLKDQHKGGRWKNLVLIKNQASSNRYERLDKAALNAMVGYSEDRRQPEKSTKLVTTSQKLRSMSKVLIARIYSSATK